MHPVSGHTSAKQITKLRAAHQAAAKLTAATGAVPEAFLGDPTFQELVSVHDKPADSSG